MPSWPTELQEFEGAAVSPKLQFGPSLCRPSSSRALIVAACISLWSLFPATGRAAPEGDATIQIDPFTAQPNQAEDGQAFCPPGTRVVGGGVTSTEATGSIVQVSGPLDETGLTSNLTDGGVGRSWYAKVYNNSPSPNTYVSTAICSSGSDATIQIDSFTVQAFVIEDGQAFCPAGSRVVGGGVTGTEATISQVRVSGPLDETGLTSNLNDGDVGLSWYAKVWNLDMADSNTFVSTAICSPGSDATIRTYPFTVQQDQSGDGQAFCPAGTRVVGGGVTGTGATGSIVQVSGPLDETGLTSNLTDGGVARSWYANVHNYGPGQNTYVSTAICAPPTSSTPKVTCKGKTATIYARPGVLSRTFKGTSNKDVIVGTSSKDKINAGAGNDLVCAGAGKDKVKGGSGKDKLFGQGGRDKLLGQAGKDLLSGGGRNDTCVGGPGKDTEVSC
jgi:Ca2+-binding RTX toxin-like protein